MADTAVAEKPKSRKPKSAPAPAAEAAPRTPKKLLVSGPKGGLGKTGCSRIIGVAASMAGLKVLLVDADAQGSLAAWHELREASGYESLAPIDCVAVDMDNAAETITKATDYDLIIIDTPNAVQAYRDQFVALIGLADFVLIPTGATFDDRRPPSPGWAS